MLFDIITTVIFLFVAYAIVMLSMIAYIFFSSRTKK